MRLNVFASMQDKLIIKKKQRTGQKNNGVKQKEGLNL